MFRKITKSYDDSESRNLIKKHYEQLGYDVKDPNDIIDEETGKPLNTGHVCDLLLHKDDDWIPIEIEQMGKNFKYTDMMIRIVEGVLPAVGVWEPGLSVPSRKSQYTEKDRIVSNKLKEIYNISYEGDLMWEYYVRITPDKTRFFIGPRDQLIPGKIDTKVNTENPSSRNEIRDAIPWPHVNLESIMLP